MQRWDVNSLVEDPVPGKAHVWVIQLQRGFHCFGVGKSISVRSSSGRLFSVGSSTP